MAWIMLNNTETSIMLVFMNLKSKLFFIISLFLLSQCKQHTTEAKVKLKKEVLKPGVTTEYLSWNENVFRDFFGKPEIKKKAMDMLRERCMQKEIADAHSCYNLGILHMFFLNQKQQAFPYFQMAVRIQPKDSLYRDAFRLAATKTDNLQAVGKDYPYYAKNIEKYNQALYHCKKHNEKLAYDLVKPLILSQIVKKQNLSRGVFADCFPNYQKELFDLAISEKVNFSNYYVRQKSSVHRLNKVWDVIYYTRKQDILDVSHTSKPLTEAWRKLLLAVKAENSTEINHAMNHFLSILRYQKAKKNKLKDLYLAIDKAAYLLIEQDPFFKKYRYLIKEF